MRRTGLLALAVLIFPAFAYAALMNINTADSKTLESLPHIGTATAQKIITYREANGPFVSIEDIRKASSYISANYYADIAPLITVGDAAATSSPVVDATSSPPIVSSLGSAAVPYVPPPSALIVDAGPDVNALLDVPLHFSVQVKMKGGAADPSARVRWSFGDGSALEGNTVEKMYRYPGTYLVTATATDGPTTTRDDLIVRVTPAQMHIGIATGSGIIIANDSNDRLDLSDWRLTADNGSFRIPLGTILLPESNALFPYEITRLSMTRDAALWYPDGTIAARVEEKLASTSTPANEVQPIAPNTGSPLVQTVEPAVTSSISEPTREISSIVAPDEPRTAVDSPGAALAAVEAAPSATSIPGPLRSPWTLGLIGVVLLAGGAFVLL